jgi:serine/threonine protein kinase
MPLAAGTRLGHFEVIALLGAGGMGEVHRARDLSLGREVALKVLPEGFAQDRSRLARFEREAHATAALNHPNILMVFEVGAEQGTPYVVSELLAGHTLRTLLGEPLAAKRALGYAVQIAEGLAAAHDKGIVHRDIKPENLFVMTDGRVKILDFGIARHADTDDSGRDATLTLPGATIGTPGYMAPEQVRGGSVDARADIFALGAVLYEMVSGQRAFGGRTGIDSLTAILNEDPPNLAELVPDLPKGVAQVVQHCLAKAREQRFQSARDVALALDIAASAVPAPAPVVGRLRTPWIAAAGLALALAAAIAGGVVSTRMRSSSTTPSVRRTGITMPASAPLSSDVYVPFALSPDGALLAYTTAQPENLFVRRLDGFDATRLAGTEGAFDPFFSPDSQWLGFWAFGQLKKVAVTGGPPIIICQAADLLGASWSENGSIVFAPGPGHGLFIVAAEGGTPKVLTTLDPEKNEVDHVFPQVIDDGRAVLFTVTARSKEAPYSVEVFDLDTKSRRIVVRGAHYGRYLPSGHLLYVRDDTLFAMKVTPGTLAPSGPAVAVLDEVDNRESGEALFAVAADGTLMYVPAKAPPESTLVWVDRTGAATNTGLPTRPYRVARVSPDGRTIAADILSAGERDIWTTSMDGATLERLTFQRRLVWSFSSLTFSHDSTHLAYAEDAEGGSRLVTQAIDRSLPSRLLLQWKLPLGPSRWLSDAKAIVTSVRGEDSGGDILVVPTSGNEGPTPLVQGPGNQFGATLSADERYVAYASDETGRFEVFVTGYPGGGLKRQLTTDGGAEPVWSPRGDEIFYRSGDRVMAIPVTTTPALTVGRSHLLFEGRFATGSAGLPAYDVAPDGRFLMMRPVGSPPTRELRVVTNWLPELRRLVP